MGQRMGNPPTQSRERKMRKHCIALLLPLFLFLGCTNKSTQNEMVTSEPKVNTLKFGFDFSKFDVVADTVRSGDVFGNIMFENNVTYPKIEKVATQFKDSFDVKRMKVGKPYFILKSKDSLNQAALFIYQNDKVNYTVIDFRDSVNVYKSRRRVKYVEREVAGIIRNNLSQTLDSLGVDYSVTINLSEIYAWSIDFFRLNEGDEFRLIYDEKYISDSIYAGSGPIKAAFFKHKDKPIYAFPFVTDSVKSISEWYDQEANNLRSTFLKAPIRFGYRISSKYNLNRRIAYYGYKRRPHLGTDYAAPIGTPIVATANGTVTESTRKGGNGKYVKIKHNSTYSTQYLHMQKQKVKKGDYVRQGDVIGWVGMTGNTSGPHVCYRFWKNGTQVNPLTQKLPSAEPIKDSLRKKYFEFIKPIKEQLDCIDPTNQSMPLLVDNDQLNYADNHAIAKNQPHKNPSLETFRNPL